MKHWLLLSFCLLFNAAFAQWDYLKLNTKNRLIADRVNVRATASEKGTVIANLPIGTEVTPIEQTENTFTLDGVEAPWYKVKFQLNGKKQEGYIWGNMIAKGFAESKDGMIFMYGIAKGVEHKKTDYSWTDFQSQVRVCKGGKEIAKLVVDEGVSFMATEDVTLTEGRGFTGIKNIFVVDFVQESCGGVGNKLFFFWDGTKLYFAHSSSEGSDAPMYWTEEQVFPDQKGGKANMLQIQRESGGEEDDAGNELPPNKESFWLKWNGKELVKQ